MKNPILLEKTYLNITEDIIDIIKGDKALSLQENLLKWIESTGLLDDNFHSYALKELKGIAEEAKTEEQLFNSLLVCFFGEPLDDDEHLSQSAELIYQFEKFTEEIEGYSIIKRDFAKFITRHFLPQHETVKHIRNIIAYL